MDNDKAVATFFELKESQAVSEPAHLDELWAALEPIGRDFMIGAWSGGELPSGHKMDGQLELARWHGKTFNSIYDVKPLVCRDDDGNRTVRAGCVDHERIGGLRVGDIDLGPVEGQSVPRTRRGGGR